MDISEVRWEFQSWEAGRLKAVNDYNNVTTIKAVIQYHVKLTEGFCIPGQKSVSV